MHELNGEDLVKVFKSRIIRVALFCGTYATENTCMAALKHS